LLYLTLLFAPCYLLFVKLVWLDEGSPPDLIAEVLKMDSAINAADKRLNVVNKDKEFLRYYRLRQMALSDYTSSMNYARAEGIHQGTLEIARKMKNAGRPLSEIAEFTTLPVETIEQL